MTASCSVPACSSRARAEDGSCPRPKRRRSILRRLPVRFCLCALACLAPLFVESVPVVSSYRSEPEPEPDLPHVNLNSATAPDILKGIPKSGPEDDSISKKAVPRPSTESMPLPPAHEDDFMTWCTQVLGIQTSLKIKEFEYNDYMRARINRIDDVDELSDDDAVTTEHDFSTISVRGLAATRDIVPGEVVISIPFHAMITVPTTIDHDPILSGILGPTARTKYGWDDVFFESPLLTIAILYHRHLGTVSPLHNYIELLESNSPVDTIPLLWDRQRLRSETTAGVRKIVTGIQKDIREMYTTVLGVLKKEHPAIFGDCYSYEDFQWAFAMVNSRHWYLPIPDLNVEEPKPSKTEESEYGYNEQVPPASQPTEEWVQELAEAEKIERGISDSTLKESHSFLAPLADLLNFGPPCTQGIYNTEKKAFELIATCPFLAGQEVTFWYSNDCDDVMIANYGFTHPMVPTCLSADDWQHRSELWKSRAEALETELENAYKELGKMDVELESVQAVLQRCDCDGAAPEPRPSTLKEKGASRVEEPTRLRHWRQESGVRGGSSNGNENNDHHARHGIRRKWHHNSKSENIGL